MSALGEGAKIGQQRYYRRCNKEITSRNIHNIIVRRLIIFIEKDGFRSAVVYNRTKYYLIEFFTNDANIFKCHTDRSCDILWESMDLKKNFFSKVPTWPWPGADITFIFSKMRWHKIHLRVIIRLFYLQTNWEALFNVHVSIYIGKIIYR